MDEAASTPSGTKRKSAQMYSEEWVHQFPWIGTCPESDHKYNCKICKESFAASIKAAKRHSSTAKHQSLSERIEQIAATSKSVKDSNTAVMKAELRLAAYAAEHNLPFTAVEHLPNLLRAVGNDVNVLNAIKLSKTKCSAIVNNVLGMCSFNTLVTQLQNSMFSLMIDESTDSRSIKHLALVVRLQSADGKISNQFLHLLPIIDYTANVMFDAIVNFFVKHSIPFKQNMVGFASDGANVIMGRRNSVSQMFLEINPDLFIMKCSCYTFALCASYACKKIPEGIETFVRQLHNYFKCNFEKMSEYKGFQEFCNLKPHKLLHASQTRWLSLISVVDKIVEQWPALKLFFTSEVSSSNNEQARMLYAQMNDFFTYSYLLFLKMILPYFADLNKEMQSEKSKIHDLYSKVANICRCIMEMFIDSAYMKQCNSLQDVEYKNPRNFINIDDLNLGFEIKMYLEAHPEIPVLEMQQFKLICIDFYVESLDQIFQRFSFDRVDLREMKNLIPKNILHGIRSSIILLAQQFPLVISRAELPALEKEWRLLRAEVLNNSHIYEEHIDFDSFWKLIFNVSDAVTPPFPLLQKLVNFINILPHSSAAVERLFSFVNLNENSMRNCLTTDSVIGVTHTSRLFHNSSCFDFDISDDMIAALSSDMYKSSISDSEKD